MAELLPVVTSLHLILRSLLAERRMTFQVVAMASASFLASRKLALARRSGPSKESVIVAIESNLGFSMHNSDS